VSTAPPGQTGLSKISGKRKIGLKGVSGGISKLRWTFKSAVFTGLVFDFSGHFCPLLSISRIFEPHFSCFRRFFNSGTRYTRKLKPTLYYWSSPTRVKAPQLGPRGYRILRSCPACGFGIKTLVFLGPIVFECSREHIPDIGTHRTHATVLTVLTIQDSQEVLAVLAQSEAGI
jgi:hypothetical protein